jgi:hypothetical protein
MNLPVREPLAASASADMRLGVDQVATPVPAKSRFVVQMSASTLHASASTCASLIDPLRLGTASLSEISLRLRWGCNAASGTTVISAINASSTSSSSGRLETELDTPARFMYDAIRRNQRSGARNQQ